LVFSVVAKPGGSAELCNLRTENSSCFRLYSLCGGVAKW
jgi:hypothetical protein